MLNLQVLRADLYRHVLQPLTGNGEAKAFSATKTDFVAHHQFFTLVGSTLLTLSMPWWQLFLRADVYPGNVLPGSAELANQFSEHTSVHLPLDSPLTIAGRKRVAELQKLEKAQKEVLGVIEKEAAEPGPNRQADMDQVMKSARSKVAKIQANDGQAAAQAAKLFEERKRKVQAEVEKIGRERAIILEELEADKTVTPAANLRPPLFMPGSQASNTVVIIDVDEPMPAASTLHTLINSSAVADAGINPDIAQKFMLALSMVPERDNFQSMSAVDLARHFSLALNRDQSSAVIDRDETEDDLVDTDGGGSDVRKRKRVEASTAVVPKRPTRDSDRPSKKRDTAVPTPVPITATPFILPPRRSERKRGDSAITPSVAAGSTKKRAQPRRRQKPSSSAIVDEDTDDGPDGVAKAINQSLTDGPPQGKGKGKEKAMSSDSDVGAGSDKE